MRLIAPILKRASELDKAKPKVAYYCRMHAVREGLMMEHRAPEVNEALSDAMEKLERAKPSLQLDDEHDELECESFALQIFAKADRADRAGQRGLNTAKMFYASSIFFNVLRQFDEGKLDADIENKQRYAEWRAAEIMKAERQGTTASPPPDDDVKERGEEVDSVVSSSQPEAAAPFAPVASPSYAPPPPPPPPHVGSPEARIPISHHESARRASPVASHTLYGKAPPGLSPTPIDIGSIADAHRHAKNAVSALGFDDVHTAVEALERALKILGPLSKK